MHEEPQPFVSLIIPCRNEKAFIGASLESALKQDYPYILEVLVIDGMSDDGTQAVVAGWADKDARVRLLLNSWKVVPHAMNVGIEAAKGEIIVRLDAHSHYPRSYVRQCVGGLLETGADNYGGIVINRPRSQSLMARVIAALTSHPFGVGNASFRHSRTKRDVGTVPFGCFRRELFKRIGLYDERLVRNQDNELNARILAMGGRIVLDPKIEIEYFNQASLSGLLRQARWTGSWNSITNYLCPHSFCWRHQVPAVFALGVLGLVPLAIGLVLAGHGQLAGLVSAPLLAYIGLGAWAAYGCSRKWGWAIGVHVPWVGFLYHFAYGLGCLWGWLLVLTGGYMGRIPASRGASPVR